MPDDNLDTDLSKDEEDPDIDTLDDDKGGDDDGVLVIDADDDDKDDKDEGKGEKKVKDKEPDDTLSKELVTLKSEVEQLKEDKKSLNTALHQARQEKKKPEDTTGKLNEAQLKQILEENPNDPDTQFNVIKYLAQEYSKGASTEAVNAAEVSRKKAELDGFLLERYPTINQLGSDIRTEIDEVKVGLGINDHPYGDYFAVAARLFDELPDLLHGAYKKGNDAGLKGKKTEDARKDDIKSGKSPDSKKAGSPGQGLTSNQADSAKQMNLSPSQMKLYKKLVGKKANAISVEE